jgi:hypothetical protein
VVELHTETHTAAEIVTRALRWRGRWMMKRLMFAVLLAFVAFSGASLTRADADPSASMSNEASERPAAQPRRPRHAAISVGHTYRRTRSRTILIASMG